MTAVAQASTTSAHPLTGYMAVHPEVLARLEQAAVDLFVQECPQSPPSLYQRAGGVLDHQVLARLSDAGIQRVFVRTEDFHQFGARLLEKVESLAGQVSIPPAERFAALQSAVAMEIERTAHTIDCGPYVAVSQRVGRDLTRTFAGNEVLPNDLFRLARHDFNTFTHVTNVAGYSIILAEKLGLASGDELEHIAKGAMLHDLGKRFIPAAILSKPAKLDREERAVIETHPLRGYEELCVRDDVSFEQLMMAYQHHEKWDGSGYPVGIARDEIHPWARMLAVVDVFDAMTGMRPYRKPATAQAAMDYIRQNAGTHFDPEVVECWDAAMSSS
jgi:HD-GYP domain-containing protein (c-di-GMP phosphodiesterase class II)